MDHPTALRLPEPSVSANEALVQHAFSFCTNIEAGIAVSIKDETRTGQEDEDIFKGEVEGEVDYVKDSTCDLSAKARTHEAAFCGFELSLQAWFNGFTNLPTLATSCAMRVQKVNDTRSGTLVPQGNQYLPLPGQLAAGGLLTHLGRKRYTVHLITAGGPWPQGEPQQIKALPSQVVPYIRARLDGMNDGIFLTEDRQRKITTLDVDYQEAAQVQAHLAQHLLGIMALTMATVQLARLKMRSLQTYCLFLTYKSMTRRNIWSHLELLAVCESLKAFESSVAGHDIQIRMNNMIVVYYINKQGGTHLLPLLYLMMKLWEWRYAHHVFLMAVHVVLLDQPTASTGQPTASTGSQNGSTRRHSPSSTGAGVSQRRTCLPPGRT
ncbi:hypothetical protein JRQ81_019004 [Phrynocephalus forsythii]|uniref:Uncharacterized protein n=1 Tax=Phrynocephalus forsythii TaxID=171643 RepID=A0A9Q0XPM6_9SAUR|nr:hypothetical protein JRQ81_019004 [Phrynocephalus forsythii]